MTLYTTILDIMNISDLIFLDLEEYRNAEKFACTWLPNFTNSGELIIADKEATDIFFMAIAKIVFWAATLIGICAANFVVFRNL